MKSPRVLVTGSMIITAALAMSACSSGTPGTSSTGAMTVVASFYPLQFAAEQIGGDHVAVTSLTKPGAEPHDIELTTQDVATVSKAGLVIYEKGLQGAVDKAAESQAGDRALNVAPAANLNLRLVSGAAAIEHEHHVDYLHDGHRHAPHQDHHDEHDPFKTHDEPVRH